MKYFQSTSFFNNNFIFANSFSQNLNYSKNFYFNNEIKERPELNSILGIGDCIVDIIAEIDKKIIEQYHLKNTKTKYIDENNKKIFDELNKMTCVYYIVGGSIQNILKSLSFSLYQNQLSNNINNDLSNINLNQNYNISMLGCVGGDIYKEKIINSLFQNKIRPLIKLTNGETSKCAVGIYNKIPFIISDIKSSKNLDEEFILSNKDIINRRILSPASI